MEDWLPGRQVGTITNPQVFTNAYELRVDRLPSKYYLYLPEPSKSDEHYDFVKHYRKYKSEKEHFYQKIGYLGRFKKGFLGRNKIEEKIKIQHIEGGEKNGKTELWLSNPIQISIDELFSSVHGFQAVKALISPVFNPNLKKKAPMNETYSFSNFTFNSGIVTKLTLTFLNKKIWLTTDTVIKVRQNCTLLHYLLTYDKTEAPQLLEGSKIIKNYGDRKSYYLCSIDYSLTPTSKLADSEETFEQYYLRKYQIKIGDLKQPLVVVQKQPSMIQKEKADQKHKRIYLIPQLVSVEDRSRKPDFPLQISKKIRQIKQLTPSQKQQQISQVINSLASEDLIKKSALKLEARALSHPTILINGSELQPEEGIFQFRNRILFSPELRSWAVAYSKEGDKDKEEADTLIGYFRNLTRIYGVNILSNPSEIVIDKPAVDNWKSALQDNFKQFGQLQIILLLFREQQQSFYSQIKEFVTVKLKCISQVVKKSTMFSSSNKKPYVIATDALIQMITKIGAAPWGVQHKKTALSSSLIIQGGLCLPKHGSNGHSCSFVGFTNKQSNTVYSFFKKQLKSKEEITTAIDNFLLSWAKKFVMNAKEPPQTVLFFREWTKQPNFKAQVDLQIERLSLLTKKIGDKLKKANYSPAIVYILVQKQSTLEFYSRTEESSNSLSLSSVSCGTAVFQEIAGNREYQFYLNAQLSANSTLKPVKFKVISNRDDISQQDVAQYVYEQCYNYFNYQGAMQVPGIMQYAYKLKQLSREFKQEMEAQNKLAQYPYFL